MIEVRDNDRTYRLPAKPTGDTGIAVALEVLAGRHRRLGYVVTDPAATENYFRLRLADAEREHFFVLFLDTRHRVIHEEIMFSGTIDGAEVSPREVVKAALFVNAAAILVAHNHPSGDSEPSAADRAVTARLRQALALIEVRLLDHIVVSRTGTTSMASRGWV